ncbi:MAG TPA: DUF5317 family protein, partial [Candidatus Limnocylindrales bacterium]
RIRYGPIMVAGLLVQIVLFTPAVTEVIGDLGPPIYVLSTAVVIGAVLMNARITGMPVIALGAISNLTAIVANGGYMPADAGAMASLGRGEPTTYSNSTILAEPALRPLTDIFVLPAWVPFTNVFSIGDVLIALGVVIVIVSAMRRRDLELAPG